MGMANIPQIAVRLISHGLPEKTPAAAICDGTRPSQRHIISTLGEISAVAAAARFEGPVLFIVGRVLEMAEALGVSPGTRSARNGATRRALPKWGVVVLIAIVANPAFADTISEQRQRRAPQSPQA